jgi:hypothetical protein
MASRTERYIHKRRIFSILWPPELKDTSTRGVYSQSENITCVVCGFSLAGIVGSNPAEGMDVCLL